MAAKATKPTKQQIAQAKARAGGNNPVKVTNKGLKKLGSAAVMAASFTPAGRVAKVAATAVKATKAAKTAKATRTLAEPKSAVRVKPAAKQVGNKYNFTKSSEEKISSLSRGGASGSLGKKETARKFKSPTNRGKADARIPARVPEQGNRGAFTYNTVKINSAKNVRVVKVKPKNK